MLLALAFAVACGAAATATPVPKAPAAEALKAPVAAAPAATVAPAATATPVPKPTITGKPLVNRLVVAGETQPYETTDPYAMSPSALPQIHVMYENLLGFDRFKLEYTPMLAESWTQAPDLSSVTFKLRKGVQWHKGYGEFTSEDVVNTYKKMVSKNSITTYRTHWKDRAMDGANPDANFAVLGPYDITFKWKSPQVDWMLFVSRIIDLSIVSKAHFDKEGIEVGPRDNPIGTGPYQLKEHKSGQGYLYERVPYKHWRVTPDFPELDYRFVLEPATRLAMLLTKEAQITQLPQDTTKQALQRGMKISVTSIPTNTLYYNMAGQYIPSRPSFDPTNPFLKKDVRKALNIAINREEIKKALFSENDEILLAPFMHPTMPASGVPADQWKPTYTRWEKRFKELYPYDPVEAKRLLAQAGYPNGFTLTLYNFPLPAAPQARELNEVLTLAWKKIGVDVKLTDREFEAVRAIYRDRDKKNMGVAVWMSTSRWDPLVWNRGQVQFYSKGEVGGFEQEYIDVRMEKILKSVDPVERGRLETEMLDYIQVEYGYIPIMWLAGEFIYNPEFVAEYITLGIHGTRDLEYVKAVLK